MKSIGTLMKAARERDNISKRTAAKRLGVTYDTYDSWERDYRLPRDLVNAKKIAEFVGKPTWVILDLAGLLDEESAAILATSIPGELKTAGHRHQNRAPAVFPIAS